MNARRNRGYRSVPLSMNRKMVIASIAGNKRSAIHSLTEIDVTRPRRFLREIHENGGLKISFTAYLVHCLAQTLKEYPELNSFIRRKRPSRPVFRGPSLRAWGRSTRRFVQHRPGKAPN